MHLLKYEQEDLQGEGEVVQLVPTHVCEGEELAMGLGLSLALHKSGLYFLLGKNGKRVQGSEDQDTPCSCRRNPGHPLH